MSAIFRSTSPASRVLPRFTYSSTTSWYWLFASIMRPCFAYSSARCRYGSSEEASSLLICFHMAMAFSRKPSLA